MKHIMLDTETLATTADAVIMSIGAVRFGLDSGQIEDQGFYASISIDSNLELSRRIDEDTLIWWLRQPQQAQAVFCEPKVPLRQALMNLADWISTDDCQVWSNGANFDLPLLAHAYAHCGMELPWHYGNTNCVRTYRRLPGAQDVPRPDSTGEHNALLDAYGQALHVMAVHRQLFGAPLPARPAAAQLKAQP